MISKILVAVDGSECANHALDFALELAEKCVASVTILNVLEVPVYGNPEEPFALSAGAAVFIKDMRKTHENLLSKAAERAALTKPNVGISIMLREGSPPDQIVDAASKGVFDMIVLGHSGMGRLKEMFLGGTSERVAHLAKCAVLIVK